MTASLANTAATVGGNEALIATAFDAQGGCLSHEDALGLLKHLDPAAGTVPTLYLGAALDAHTRQGGASPPSSPSQITPAGLIVALESCDPDAVVEVRALAHPAD